MYKDSDIVHKMSPAMEKPVLINYNKDAYELLYGDLHG